VTVCPSCGRANPADARFCNACGTVLGGESARPREERKVVTVLFADLVGFTARAEQLDPEDVRALLSPYHRRLRTELERFGGTVEKFIGDAVMALFGAPRAHEDDAERAVRAALAIRDWVLDEEEDLQLRIAVNTGPALVAVEARVAEGEERDRIWEAQKRLNPGFAEYEQKTDRAIPVVILRRADPEG
jgi:class 3 adenylate cyclase